MSPDTIGGLVLGGVLVITYVVYGVVKKKKTTLVNAGVVVFASEGLVNGCRLIVFVFDPQLQKLAAPHGISPWPIGFGGIALIWVSFQAIVQAFREKA